MEPNLADEPSSPDALGAATRLVALRETDRAKGAGLRPGAG